MFGTLNFFFFFKKSHLIHRKLFVLPCYWTVPINYSICLCNKRNCFGKWASHVPHTILAVLAVPHHEHCYSKVQPHWPSTGLKFHKENSHCNHDIARVITWNPVQPVRITVLIKTDPLLTLIWLKTNRNLTKNTTDWHKLRRLLLHF